VGIKPETLVVANPDEDVDVGKVASREYCTAVLVVRVVESYMFDLEPGFSEICLDIGEGGG
jgi:hypothetical protein